MRLKRNGDRRPLPGQMVKNASLTNAPQSHRKFSSLPDLQRIMLERILILEEKWNTHHQVSVALAVDLVSDVEGSASVFGNRHFPLLLWF
jgi:hypothetical protein